MQHRACTNNCGRVCNPKSNFLTCCQGCSKGQKCTDQCNALNGIKIPAASAVMPTISIMTWNIGQASPSTTKQQSDAQIIQNIISSTQEDFYCFQEVTKGINYINLVPNYLFLTAGYDYVNSTAKFDLVVAFKVTNFSLIDIKTQPITGMITEDSNKPTQKFTRFMMLIVQEKSTGRKFNICPVHLKGGPTGYQTKLALMAELVSFIGPTNGYTLIAGDFNIDYNTRRLSSCGFELLASCGYHEDPFNDCTHKQKSTVPDVKYDYVFFTNNGNSQITPSNCTVITPNNANDFDHYPKIVTFQ